MDIVTIFDTLNKFIAYSGPIPHVINILFEWNAIYVLAGDNKLYMLLEKATQTKLEILFKKNQYITAIKLVTSFLTASDIITWLLCLQFSSVGLCVSIFVTVSYCSRNLAEAFQILLQ